MNIADEVKLVISKTLKIPVEKLTDETKLEDLGAESLEILEMVFDLEEKFDITIALKPTTVGAVASTAAGRSDNLTFNTIGDVLHAVKDLVDAKPAR